MQFENVKELIKIIENSSILDFELKLDNMHIRMNKNNSNSNSNKAISSDKVQFNKDESFNKIAKTISEPITIIPEKNVEKKEGNIITSPIVGTFYKSQSPDKPPFVKVGDKVKVGDVLCIIEAMKVMNEISSKFDGEVVEILVDNEQMVEYNQPLFRIV